MKTTNKFIFTIILIFALPNMLISQEEVENSIEELVENPWFLTKLIINEEETLFIPNEEVEQSLFVLNQWDWDSDNIVDAEILYCEYGNTSIQIEEDCFSITEFVYLMIDGEWNCTTSNNNSFHFLYFDGFWNNPDLWLGPDVWFPFHFTYTITEFEDYQQLIVINDNGDEAHFQNVPNMSVEKHQQNDLLVYPNPVKDFIQIENLTERANLEIYDLLGKQIFQQEINSSDESLDVSDLSNGLYFYNIFQNGKSMKTGKLVKK